MKQHVLANADRRTRSTWRRDAVTVEQAEHIAARVEALEARTRRA